MIHKGLQANIIREDRLCSLRHAAVARGARVRGRRVELGEQETSLRAASVADDEARKWEAVLDEFLSHHSQYTVSNAKNGIETTYPRVFLGCLQ